MKKEQEMEQVREVDISNGISPKAFIEALKAKKTILKGSKKRIEIENNQLRVIMQEELEMEHIPEQINGIKLTDLHKKMLLNGKEILLGDQSIKLSEDQKVLKMERPNQQKNDLKIG